MENQNNEVENKQHKRVVKLVDNEFLKKISKKRYYIQPIYIFILFIAITIIIFESASKAIVESLNIITTVNVTLFAVNLALLVFVAPYFIKDKIKHMEAREQIKEYKIQGKVRKAHLMQLKDIDVRIVLDGQTLNLLYFQTILLVATFCISVLFLAFVPNALLVTAVNGSHIIVEISYIINLLVISGIWMHTKDLERMYADMITYESNLLNNSGTYVHVFTNKDLRKIKKKQKRDEKKIKKENSSKK